MDASEMKTAQKRLILRRNEIIKGLRARTANWAEFERVCRTIVALDNKLGEGVPPEQAQDSAQ